MTSDEHPSLRQLLIFDAVMETGSVGGAARQLRLSQPAVTHALNKLEQMLAMALLHRGQEGSHGTQAGHILHRRVIRLRALIAQGLAAACGEEADEHAIATRAAALTSTHVAAHVAVARERSFRAAARALGISEPAIQRTARDLEQMVGAPLYRRHGQAVGVTPQGLMLASRMQLALAEIDQARDEIAMARGLANGRLVLGCLPLMPKGVVASALGRLLQRFPEVRVTLEEGSYDHLGDVLKRGDLDMVLGSLRGDPQEQDLIERVLFADPYVILCRREHPLAGQARAPDAQDLAQARWIAAPAGTPRRTTLERLFATLPQRPSIVLETASVPMVIATLTESDCLTLSSREQAALDFASLSLAQWPLAPEQSGERQVGITMRRNWLPTTVQYAFLEALSPGVASGNAGPA